MKKININKRATSKEEKEHSYVEIVAKYLKDKMVEVYLGDTYEQIQLADYTTIVNSVIVGKIIDAENDCLILDSFFVNKENNQVESGNIQFINGYNIKTISPLDGDGTLNDIFINPKRARKIKLK